MSKFARISTAAAALLIAAAVLQPALAACGAAALITTTPQVGARSYVWNEEVFTPYYGYPPYVYGYSQPFTPNLQATWWKLGTGDPAPGPGDDVGSFDPVAAGGIFFYGSGGTYYAGQIFTGWGANPAIDGCIDTQGSCTCLLLTDNTGDAQQVALVAGRASSTLDTELNQPGNDGSGNSGPIILRNVKPFITLTDNGGDSTSVDVTVRQDALQGIYDNEGCDCQAGAQARFYLRSVPRGSAAPDSRDLAQWNDTGAVAPLGSPSSPITVNCSDNQDVYVASVIEFTTVAGGAAPFTTPNVSSNSTRVECGPSIADQPVEIQRPRQNRPLAPRKGGRR